MIIKGDHLADWIKKEILNVEGKVDGELTKKFEFIVNRATNEIYFFNI